MFKSFAFLSLLFYDVLKGKHLHTCMYVCVPVQDSIMYNVVYLSKYLVWLLCINSNVYYVVCNDTYSTNLSYCEPCMLHFVSVLLHTYIPSQRFIMLKVYLDYWVENLQLYHSEHKFPSVATLFRMRRMFLLRFILLVLFYLAFHLIYLFFQIYLNIAKYLEKCTTV